MVATVDPQPSYNFKEMCLNELDLSQFLSENSPVPHDVNFQVFDDFSSSETFKAHRYKIFTENCRYYCIRYYKYLFGELQIKYKSVFSR